MKEMLGYCSRHLCWPKDITTMTISEWLKNLVFLISHNRKANEQSCQWLTAYWSYRTKERENVGWLKRRLFYYTTPDFLHYWPCIRDRD